MTETVTHYVRVAPDEPLRDISFLAPFKAIIVLDADYSTDWQNEVSDWLVRSGCRYMMAWGPNCSEWDDSVDHAVWHVYPGTETPPHKFVMTTWHENESLEGVFWYSQFCANFSYDDIALTNAVILHISQQDRRSELLDLFKQSRTLAEREVDEP